ncbi:MAG: hypothetical protein HYR95_01655 [Candidatus Colwellbacteria bacterium]|nr:hypothetical protein [Candidatus Colwellbacteria bacterium]
MRSPNYIILGGVSGSFAAPSGYRLVRDETAPFGISHQDFDRKIHGARTFSIGIVLEGKTSNDDDTFIVVDQGSGVEIISRFISSVILSKQRKRVVVHNVQTHGHGDHTVGTTCNELFFDSHAVMRFHSPNLSAFRKMPETGIMMDRVIRRSFDGSDNFPVGLNMLHATQEHIEFRPGETIQLGPVKALTMAVPHPGGCVAYRFELPGGIAVVVATDLELPEEPDHAFVEFLNGARVALLEMQYDEEELKSCIGWGHSTPVRMFRALAKCRKRPPIVRSVHLDPSRDDMAVRRFHEAAALDAKGIRLHIRDFAPGKEGEVIWLPK